MYKKNVFTAARGAKKKKHRAPKNFRVEVAWLKHWGRFGAMQRGLIMSLSFDYVQLAIDTFLIKTSFKQSMVTMGEGA